MLLGVKPQVLLFRLCFAGRQVDLEKETYLDVVLRFLEKEDRSVGDSGRETAATSSNLSDTEFPNRFAETVTSR